MTECNSNLLVDEGDERGLKPSAGQQAEDNHVVYGQWHNESNGEQARR